MMQYHDEGDYEYINRIQKIILTFEDGDSVILDILCGEEFNIDIKPLEYNSYLHFRLPLINRKLLTKYIDSIKINHIQIAMLTQTLSEDKSHSCEVDTAVLDTDCDLRVCLYEIGENSSVNLMFCGKLAKPTQSNNEEISIVDMIKETKGQLLKIFLVSMACGAIGMAIFDTCLVPLIDYFIK